MSKSAKIDYNFAYQKVLQTWNKMFLQPLVQAKGSRRSELIHGMTFVGMSLSLIQYNMNIQDALPTHSTEGVIYINQTVGIKGQGEANRWLKKIQKSLAKVVKAVPDSKEFDKAYPRFIKTLQDYWDFANSFVVMSDPLLKETFTWKGLKFINHSFTEKEVRQALDGISWCLDLFKRRGMNKLVLESLRVIVLDGEKETPALGGYYASKKTLQLYKKALGRIQETLEEVFIHELGHHVHLNLLPKEAREFWEGGWELVDEAKIALEDAMLVTPQDIEAYRRELSELNWDFQALGRNKQGLERLKYVGYLHNQGFINGVKRVRLTQKAQELQWELQNPEQAYFVKRLGLEDESLWNLDDPKFEAFEKRLYSSLGADKTYPEPIPQQLKEDLRAKDKSVDDALNALSIPTAYGRTDVKEDFAETFLYFMTKPETLSDIAKWRMGRTLGMSKSLGTKIIRMSNRIVMRYLVEGNEHE